MTTLSADGFLDRLMSYVSANEPTRAEGSFRYDEDDEFIAVRMRDIFALAKEFIDLSPADIEALLEKDPQPLRDFLDHHAATMPRVMLRYAIERLDGDEREHYRGLKSS